jgi:hypothetical protein
MPNKKCHIPRQEKDMNETLRKGAEHFTKHFGPVMKALAEEKDEVANKESWWYEQLGDVTLRWEKYNESDDTSEKPIKLKDEVHFKEIISIISFIEQKTRQRVIDEALEIVRNVNSENASNGRYNACQEILQALKELKQ